VSANKAQEESGARPHGRGAAARSTWSTANTWWKKCDPNEGTHARTPRHAKAV